MNSNKIGMYKGNSTFISLSENTKENGNKVDAAKKTLDIIYKVHDKVNQSWEQNEKLKKIKAAIGKSKKIIRVSSDIHGDINCLISNLNNIIKLKENNFLVVDPTNGEEIFYGTIEVIKSDLAKGKESEIKQKLGKNENNIVLLYDFDIRDDFYLTEAINVITGDHIDRGPHSAEVLCMELQVKKKLEEKLKEKKLKIGDHKNEINEIINENKINENNDDKEILEGKNNLVLTIGDHETGCHGETGECNVYGPQPSENESAANSLAKKMIEDGNFVPAYLHKSKNVNIISHSHVMFLIPHVFQVFRQIDELEKLLALEKDIDNDNFFNAHEDNEFVQILANYGESDERGKMILKSLIKTYQKVLKNKKYEKILKKIGIAENNGEFVNKFRRIIEKHGENFYKDWDSCVNTGYNFYKEVEKELNLSTEDFFMLRNFAMDVFSRPIADNPEIKKELTEKFTEIADGYFNPNSLLVCFADYFSDAKKYFWVEPTEFDLSSFQINSCLLSLNIIKFRKNNGYVPNMYWERLLIDLEQLKKSVTWKIKNEKNFNKLIFPGVSQIIGHDQIIEHRIQFYDKSIINNDTASSVGYDDPVILECKNTCYPNEIIYDPESPEQAYNVTFQVNNLTNCSLVQVKVVGVQEIKLGYHTKEDLEKAIHEDKTENKIEIKKEKENEKEDENKNKKEKENENKIKINDKDENKDENKNKKENEKEDENKNKKENKDENKDENENENEKENKTGGTYLMKWLLIIFGLLLIGVGIGLFFAVPTLAVKIFAIGLGILGVAGFGFGIFYKKIVERYCEESESCCFRFWTYTISKPKQKNKENDINLKKEENDIAGKDENVFK